MHETPKVGNTLRTLSTSIYNGSLNCSNAYNSKFMKMPFFI